MADDPLARYLAPQTNTTDPLADSIRKDERQRAASALLASEFPPDVAAQARDLSVKTGIPLDTVARNLPAFRQQDMVQRASSAMESDPKLATWAANPANAAVAGDDMDHLAANARYWRRAASGSISATPAPAPTLWNMLKGVGTSLVEGTRQIGIGLENMAADFMPDMMPKSAPGIPRLGNYGAENSKRAFERSQARVDSSTPEFKSEFARGLYGGTSSLAQMIPGVAAAVVTGQPELALAAAGVQQGLPAYSKYRARGATPGQALLDGALEGGIEVATEKMPMGFIVDKLGKQGAGEFIRGFLGRELPGEMAATLGQNAVDTAIANPDKTWGQYMSEQPDALVQTAIGTLVSAGFFAGANHVASHVLPQAQKAEQATAQADALNQAMDHAAASKVRGRAADAYAELVAMHTEGTPMENVYIPASIGGCYFICSGSLPA